RAAVRARRHPPPAAVGPGDLAARPPPGGAAPAPRGAAPPRPPAPLDAGSAPLGTPLAVAAGLADFRARRDNRAQARVRVLVDDKPVAERLVGNDDGFAPLPDIATTPGPHHVVFVSEAVPAKGKPVNL